jgi:hypothetical protein
LAIDVVANEGKGIFYAKNKLGMTDRISNSFEFERMADDQLDEIIKRLKQ